MCVCFFQVSAPVARLRHVIPTLFHTYQYYAEYLRVYMYVAIRRHYARALEL